MQALRSELSKHRITRGLVANDSGSKVDIGIDPGLRRELEWQIQFAAALHGYSDAVASAFAALSRAQQALGLASLEEHPELAETTKALVEGFRAAHGVAVSAAEATRVPLQTHRAALSSCAEDVAKADAAAAELSRYSGKISALADAEHERQDRGQASSTQAVRIARNRDKLKQAANVASLTHSQAEDSLQACASKRGALCKLASEALTGTVEALSRGSLHLASGGPRVRRGTSHGSDAGMSEQARTPSGCVQASPSGRSQGPPRLPLPTQEIPHAPISPCSAASQGSEFVPACVAQPSSESPSVIPTPLRVGRDRLLQGGEGACEGLPAYMEQLATPSGSECSGKGLVERPAARPGAQCEAAELVDDRGMNPFAEDLCDEGSEDTSDPGPGKGQASAEPSAGNADGRRSAALRLSSQMSPSSGEAAEAKLPSPSGPDCAGKGLVDRPVARPGVQCEAAELSDDEGANPFAEDLGDEGSEDTSTTRPSGSLASVGAGVCAKPRAAAVGARPTGDLAAPLAEEEEEEEDQGAGNPFEDDL